MIVGMGGEWYDDEDCRGCVFMHYLLCEECLRQILEDFEDEDEDF